MDLFDKCKNNDLMDLVAHGRKEDIYPYFHEITSKQHSEVTIDGHRTIMLGSNNYMGLTSDKRVIKAAVKALKQYGTGCSGSRFLNGTLSLHIALEKELARFTGFGDVMTFSTGFQTNIGIIATVCGRGDYILTDRGNHASLVDACRLSFAKTIKYDHNDMVDLENQLKNLPPEAPKLIVTDGVFSMEGDLANIPELARLKKLYNARLMVDDSHGLGVMGRTGKGTAEYYGMAGEVDILMGTFSKSFASLGGFMAAESYVIDYCRHASRPFIFSASIPPSNAAAVLEALSIIESEPWRLTRVLENADYMRKSFKQLGIPAGDSVAPIIPINTFFSDRTFRITKALLDNGVYVNPVIAPAVPEGQTILRTSYIATHTIEQLNYALDAFDKVFNKLMPLSDEEKALLQSGQMPGANA